MNAAWLQQNLHMSPECAVELYAILTEKRVMDAGILYELGMSTNDATFQDIALGYILAIRRYARMFTEAEQAGGRRCGRCKQHGHNARTCPNEEVE